MGTVYSVPLGNNFLRVVLDRLMNLPNMADAVVYVPTNRLGKALQLEILRTLDGRAVLMPEIKTLGDDGDILNHSAVLQGGHIPLCVDALNRRFWLADAITKFHKSRGNSLSFSASLSSADDLARLFDRVALYETHIDAFKDLFTDGDYATHWGISLAFLNAIYPAWQEYLKSKGMMDIGIYKHQSLQSLKTIVEQEQRIVFLVGATANYPVIKDLMLTVANMDNGVVFISAYDTDYSPQQMKNIIQDVTHPQHTLQFFVNELGVENIQILGNSTDRATLFKSVFLPARNTGIWRSKSAPVAGFDTLGFVESETMQKEALSIALMMRETLNVAGKTCALMTPNRQLSRMVISLLKRWNIAVDDSSGQPLDSTPAGLFMRLVLQTVDSSFSPFALMALLKHPFCTLGMDKGEVNRTIHALEMFGLRGYYGTGGLDDLINYIQTSKEDKFKHYNPYKEKADEAIVLLKKVQSIFVPLLQNFSSFKDLVQAHITVCEGLSSVDTLWNKDDGNVLASTMNGLLKNAEEIKVVSLSDYTNAFTTLLGGQTVRKTIGLHPRLFIFGSLEARLQSVDRMIIAGLNEGIFPAKTKTDAWLSRGMAGEVGLPISDTDVGISANDFISACNGVEVVFSRYVKEDGKQTIPSRWWQRFLAVSKACGLDSLPPLHINYTYLAENLDGIDVRIQEAVRISVPKPTPPVEFRPQGLSVTNIQTWLEDPYQIYCKYVLKIFDGGDLWGEMKANIKGTLYHGIFEEFIQKNPDEVRHDFVGELLKIGQKHFAPLMEISVVKSFWWADFESVAQSFINECVKRNDNLGRVVTETKAKYRHKTKGGNTFEISGTADRIEILKDGYCNIIDYKSGTKISMSSVKNGTAPQLPLQAYMLGQKAFLGVDSRKVEQVEYWYTKRNFEVTNSTDSKGKESMDEIVDNAVNMLDGLVDRYANVHTPYYTENRITKYNDYAHLMREKEWGDYDEDEGANDV